MVNPSNRIGRKLKKLMGAKVDKVLEAARNAENALEAECQLEVELQGLLNAVARTRELLRQASHKSDLAHIAVYDELREATLEEPEGDARTAEKLALVEAALALEPSEVLELARKGFAEALRL